MWTFLKRLFGLEEENTPWKKYSVDHSGIHQINCEDECENYSWNDVKHIGIFTTEDGPWGEDVFFVINTDLGDVCITHADAQKMELLKYFERFPGFNWGQVVEAMSCCSEARFPCWDRDWPTSKAS